ncbi:SPOR domain-containing protein [Paraglaciecola sp. 2405UD69-4]|uniref:SPOR domain-containing protein n=1 Tax=Paraglaciecola sp. 2405UD69-4 TaxID=3391836 RepID=UPI0039C969D6
MATSELSDRLDYLISYSSQLVFVCTDKIKQQSLVIDNFLSQQSEHTEVALVTANPLTPLASYRESIFQQLLNTPESMDFHRPLNQVLSPLNNQDDTVLICIFQADKLPNKLVKEIWELVLQSRFASNKQHLNVLLMGDSEWAEKMKIGLGSRSKDKPIILNSHNTPVQYNADLDKESLNSLENTDLETLLQQNRQRFAQRMKDRHQETYVETPLLKKWWMIALLSIIFLLTFAGILGWQYSDNLVNWFAHQNSNTEITQPILDKDSAPNLADDAKLILEEQKSDETPASTQTNNELNTLLVTDWPSAVKEMTENTAQLTQAKVVENTQLETESLETTKQDTLLNLVKPDADLALASSEVDEVIVETTVTNSPSQETDYAIPDVTVEPQKTIEAPNSDASEKGVGILPEPLSDNTNEIMALPNTHFVIQISALTNPKTLIDYVIEEKLESELWVYQVHRNQVNWYVLIYKASFPTIDAAKQHMLTLSPAMLKNTPFIKQVSQIQQEILAQVH